MAGDEANGRGFIKRNVHDSRRKGVLRINRSVEIARNATTPVALRLPLGGADAREGRYIRCDRFTVLHELSLNVSQSKLRHINPAKSAENLCGENVLQIT